MLIADLKVTCPACNGSGQKAGVMAGGIPQINVGGRCGQCEGRGFLLTPLGQDLWKIFQPFVEKLIQERRTAAQGR
jgi:hypothetical protein